MTPQSSAAADVAGRLWSHTVGDATSPDEVAVAADLLCIRLRAGLGRWIGIAGYTALLDRALARARAEHPVLEGVSCLGEDGAAIEAAVSAQGAARWSAGLVACVAALVELLGRIIGSEMAVRLVEQTGIPSPRGVVSTRTQGGRDDDQAAASEDR